MPGNVILVVEDNEKNRRLLRKVLEVTGYRVVEVETGRLMGGPRHGPRTIDVDVLLLDGLEHESERLRIPHGDLLTRRFVLAPLVELDPDLTLPDGTRLADALAGLEGQRVESVGSL